MDFVNNYSHIFVNFLSTYVTDRETNLTDFGKSRPIEKCHN